VGCVVVVVVGGDGGAEGLGRGVGVGLWAGKSESTFSVLYTYTITARIKPRALFLDKTPCIVDINHWTHKIFLKWFDRNRCVVMTQNNMIFGSILARKLKQKESFKQLWLKEWQGNGTWLGLTQMFCQQLLAHCGITRLDSVLARKEQSFQFQPTSTQDSKSGMTWLAGAVGSL
jgi:hypothetical protein